MDDECDAWYFRGDGTGTARKNPEVRFIAEGVQTTTQPYTLITLEVGSFSFDYAIVNDDPQGVDDIASEDYIVQILGADDCIPLCSSKLKRTGIGIRLRWTNRRRSIKQRVEVPLRTGNIKINSADFCSKWAGSTVNF